MDGRGGCCIARCDTSKIDRIMLRFRPIAPKPVASGADSAIDKADDGRRRSLKAGRGRRRRKKSAVKDNSKGGGSSSGSDDNASGSRCKKRRVLSPKGGGVPLNTVVTLPLLPESPDLTVDTTKGHKAPVWLSFDGKIKGKEGVDYYANYPSVREHLGIWPGKHRELVRSWLIVECVTVDRWMEADGMLLGKTDEQKKKILEEDTCPGLISDIWNRVWWTNKAYRKMACSRDGREDAEVVVWVVMKEKVAVTCEAFTCRVRVKSAENQQETLPCDVWRMSDGGFAWRLDVKAALSLGR